MPDPTTPVPGYVPPPLGNQAVPIYPGQYADRPAAGDPTCPWCVLPGGEHDEAMHALAGHPMEARPDAAAVSMLPITAIDNVVAELDNLDRQILEVQDTSTALRRVMDRARSDAPAPTPAGHFGAVDDGGLVPVFEDDEPAPADLNTDAGRSSSAASAYIADERDRWRNTLDALKDAPTPAGDDQREAPDDGPDEDLIRKWDAASDAARKSEHHFPADCLREAVAVYRVLAARPSAPTVTTEQIEARLREHRPVATVWLAEQRCACGWEPDRGAVRARSASFAAQHDAHRARRIAALGIKVTP